MSGSADMDWLVARFADTIDSVEQVVVVSSDGLPLATSAGVPRDTADRLAAVASGMIGLAYGSAGRFGGGSVSNVIIEMEHRWLFVTGIRDGSLMCVVSDASADIGAIGYEMAVFAERAGEVLTPELRAQLSSGITGGS